MGGDGSKRPVLPIVEDDARCEEQDCQPTAYLQLLDMHGADDNSNNEEVEDESATNDWEVVYVDQVHTQDSG